MNYLLDTNVISELRKREPDQNVLRWSESVSLSEVFISVVTVWEIDLRIKRLARRDVDQARMLSRWLESKVIDGYSGRVLAVDLEVARRVGELHVPDPAPERDALIAATALTHGLTVATRNPQRAGL